MATRALLLSLERALVHGLWPRSRTPPALAWRGGRVTHPLLDDPRLLSAIIGLSGSFGALAGALRSYARRARDAESTRRSNLSEYVRRQEKRWELCRAEDAVEKQNLRFRLDDLNRKIEDLLRRPRMMVPNS